ncbi:MAG: hypothetical protein LT080_08735 [Thiobacillus sp.]|nr:hypothetical protein [Thiobacillus sp.]
MSFVSSSIPGRIRLRHAALRNPDRLARIERSIGAWPQVRAVSTNAKAGSLLVTYDAAALDANDCAKRCEAAVAELLPGQAAPASARAAPASPRHGSPRVRANRMAKRAMLASLAASMLLAAVGAKRWHIGTGVFFLHALGVHLWVHRRHLIR